MGRSILIVDDELSIGQILSRFLTRHGYATTVVTSGSEALKVIKDTSFDLVLCDYNLGDISGKEVLKKVVEQHPDTIVIFISGMDDISTVVNLIKEGAYHFLTKPLYPDQVLKTIEDAFMSYKPSLPSDSIQVYPVQHSAKYIKGKSAAAQRLFQHINLVAPTDYNVIIHGETGTGKEALAKFLHTDSRRVNQPFIAIDCGSLSKDLAGSELFGHKKGAFTGALNDKKGAFEMADGGTLFLDEIGNLPYDVQNYLLRAIQENTVRRVGDIMETKVDVRVIVASNEHLPELVATKKFREDLYHRLNEFTLEVPMLRDRKEDIPLFIDEFMLQAAQHLGRKNKGFTPEVMDLFINYSWPGNIRELQNVIKRTCLLTPPDQFIDVKSLPLEMTMQRYSGKKQIVADEEVTNTGSGLKDAALEAERVKIFKVLEKVNYNKTKAAEILEIDRKTLYNKLKIINEETK